MTAAGASGPPMDDLGWGWLARGRRQIQGCLTLVREAPLDLMLEEFGMDPGAARLLPEDRARELFLGTDRPWVRVGRARGWTFAIEEISLIGAFEDASERLSAGTSANADGTEVAVVYWTAKPSSGLWFMANRNLVTSFEPDRAWERAGSDPDRFLPEMRRVGLDTDGPPPRLSRAERLVRLRRFDPIVAAARMLTLALEIRVPSDLVRAPLLTAQRPPD